MNTVQTLPLYLLKIHFNIILAATPKSSVCSLFRLSNQNFVRISHSDARYMSRQSHRPWCYHPNDISCRVQVMNLIISRLSRVCYLFFPHRSKHSPQHFVLKCSSSVFFKSRLRHGCLSSSIHNRHSLVTLSLTLYSPVIEKTS
jgi:hypothetical protein